MLWFQDATQLTVVLYYPIMDHCQLSIAICMRMCVGGSNFTMSCPTDMSYTYVAMKFPEAMFVVYIGKLADIFPECKPIIVDRG